MAGPTVECGWKLGTGADRGDGRGPRAEAIPACAVTALGTFDDPGTPGKAKTSRAPTGAGECCAGKPGDGEIAVATGRIGGVARHRRPGGGRRKWDRSRGRSRCGPSGQLSLRA